MTRRVLVLNHFAAPRGAPGGTRHVELFGRLRGWDARILTANRNLLDRRKVVADGTVRPVWVAPHSGNGPTRVLSWLSYAVTSVVAGLRWGGADVVYASSPHLLAGAAGWCLSRLWRVPLVLEVRDLWPQVLVDMGTLGEGSLVHRVLRGLESFLYGRAQVVVVMAEGPRRTLEARGVPADRLVLIPNGADPEDFRPPRDRAALRAERGLEGVVVAYTGAHGPANGLDLALDAAGELARVRPEVRLLLVGDGVEKAALQRRAADEGLSNVTFVDAIPKEEVPALLGAVDIGLHVLADVPLFRYGVSPNKLFDYMAAGLPVLTNTPGEVADVVRTAGAGLAVEPGGIAAGIRAMADAGPAQRRAWGEAGRCYVGASRSRTMLAGELQRVLDGLSPEGARR